MKWTRTGKYTLESDAGHVVCRTGPDHDPRYTAWAPGAYYCWSLAPIGTFSDPQAAKRCCEDHAREAA